jgi:thiamine biosynthesis lipoprotein
MTAAAAVPYRHVESCMGTVFSIDVRSPGVSADAVRDVVAWLHYVDRTYSTFRPDSAISRIAAGTLAERDASEEVRWVLATCRALAEETGGYFTLYPGGALDPSGFVKGWAIERASDLLVEAGSLSHCITGGGDVQCVGRPAAGADWTIGIADPLHPLQLIGRAQGSGELAVATSGNAERGPHIVERAGGLADELASVTVVGHRLAHADALATALFAMGHGVADWLAQHPELTVFVVENDGSSRMFGVPAAA